MYHAAWAASTGNKWLISATRRVAETPFFSLPPSSPQIQNPRKLVFFWGVWEFGETRDRPVRPLSTGYPHVTVDNSSGVWEF
jgi:hypothetical protein